MRLEKLHVYLRHKGREYQYTEETDCVSIDWEYRGFMCHVLELPGFCAENNVRIAGIMEDYTDDHEEQDIEVMERWV